MVVLAVAVIAITIEAIAVVAGPILAIAVVAFCIVAVLVEVHVQHCADDAITMFLQAIAALSVHAGQSASPEGLQAASGPVAHRVGCSHLVGDEAGDVRINLLWELHR